VKLTKTRNTKKQWIADINKLIPNQLYLAMELDSDNEYIVQAARGDILHPIIVRAILFDCTIRLDGEFKFLPISIEEIKFY